MGSDSAAFDIVVNGQDEGATATVEQVNQAIGNTPAKAQEANGALENLHNVMGTIHDVTETVGQVWDKVIQIWDASIAKALELADEVRKVSAETGMNAEETSRMIDLYDKFNISSNTVALTQKTLAKEGLTLSIETLKKLADQYNALGTQEDRTTFLTKNFGRSGLEMADMFNQGSAAIQKFNDTVGAGQIVTQAELDQARQLEIANKDLADSWSGLVNILSFRALPILQAVVGVMGAYATTAQDVVNGTSKETGYFGPLIEFLKNVKASRDEYNASLKETTNAQVDAGQSAVDLAESEKAVADANKSELSTISSLQSVQDNYDKSMASLSLKSEELLAKKQDLIHKGYGPETQAIKDVNGQLNDTTKAQADVAAAFDKSSKQIVFNLLQQNLAAKGMTDASFNALLKVGEDFGLVSPKVAGEASKINDAIAGIDTAHLGDFESQISTIMALPDQKKMAIGYNIVQTGTPLQVTSDRVINVVYNVTTNGNLPGGGGGGSPSTPQFQAQSVGVSAQSVAPGLFAGATLIVQNASPDAVSTLMDLTRT